MAAENTNKNLQIKIKPRKAQWGCPRPALLHLQGRARGDGSAKVRRMVMVSCFHDKDVHGYMFLMMRLFVVICFSSWSLPGFFCFIMIMM